MSKVDPFDMGMKDFGKQVDAGLYESHEFRAARKQTLVRFSEPNMPDEEAKAIPNRVPMNCYTCLAWKLKPNQASPIFGGCAKGGKTTTHYGDTTYVHYTTNLQSCSAWESK